MNLFKNLVEKNQELDDSNATEFSDDILLVFDEAKDSNDVEVFDEAMERLYNFADYHRILIKTKC